MHREATLRTPWVGRTFIASPDTTYLPPMMSDVQGPPDRDMPTADFVREGRRIVEWIADYLENPDRVAVLSRSAPGSIRAAIGSRAPEEGVSMTEILADFERVVMPGITHWNHPGFFAYFATSASGPAILGEMLAAALNVNAMLWRTSPAATELEDTTTGWLRDMMGLPAGFRGHIQDTASVSTLVALATAREALGLKVRELGLAGRPVPLLRVYCSDEAHSSVEKAAITLGLGRIGVRRIPVDDAFRMDAGILEAAITGDVAAGVTPMAVVATVGTTSTTSVDPVDRIADLCERHGLWLHVDAAYGGAAALMPEMRPLMKGWERASSIVVNPHKWLFVPIDCSVLFLRDPALARRAFDIVPDYLATPEGDTVTNLMDYGPALGRRFRSLKLWMTLSYFGRIGIAARIAEHIRLARRFAGWVAAAADWEVAAPVPFSTVCFRFHPAGMSDADADRTNERILETVNGSGDVFLSHTRVHGRYTIRLAIGNIRTEERHVELAWRQLRTAVLSFGF